MEWLAVKSLFGLPRWGIIAAIIALVAAGAITVVIIADHTVHTTLQTVTTTAEQAGETKAVVAGQTTTLQQVGAAHEATNNVRNGASSAKYDECVRDSAQGYAGFCERYKPVEPVPGRRPADDPTGAPGGR